VDVVRRNRAFEDFNVLLGTDSPDQIPGANGQIASQHLVAVFGHPT